jgi:hypothetical protein
VVGLLLLLLLFLLLLLTRVHPVEKALREVLPAAVKQERHKESLWFVPPFGCSKAFLRLQKRSRLQKVIYSQRAPAKAPWKQRHI